MASGAINFVDEYQTMTSGCRDRIIEYVNMRTLCTSSWTSSGYRVRVSNMGGFTGGAISLGLKLNQNHVGRVSDGRWLLKNVYIIEWSCWLEYYAATYFALISIICTWLPLAAAIPRPSQVQRSDGTHNVEHRFRSWNKELPSLRSVLSLKALFGCFNLPCIV